MRRFIIAAALALAPGAALADHNHGGHDQHAHGAAQSMLAASTPSDGAVLAEAPRSLALMFAHPVALQSVVVTGPSGAVTTSFRQADAAAARYSIALPAGLAAGNYEARWTASGEGHHMNGVIRFAVQ
jgi:methionine-rich copper-binding protein CopC